MFGLSLPVFVWLLSVRLLARDIWLADGHLGMSARDPAGAAEARAQLWSHPLLAAYWSAERARWAEEEAVQDEAAARAVDGLVDTPLAPLPPPVPHIHPDTSPEEEADMLAWGTTSVRGKSPGLKRFARVRLGPRPEDLFEMFCAGDGEPHGKFW